MRQKELRLALVCYGGISLAVYMHGITKEVWSLARASRDSHAGSPPGTAVERVYAEMLDHIATRAGVRLRVLVDIVAGASAGGLNGVFLAQAIHSGQSLEPLTHLWLERADVDALLAPGGRGWGGFTKRWAVPVVRHLFGGADLAPDTSVQTRAEVQAKLARLVCSRWFEAPFGGLGFSRLIAQALDAMAAGPAQAPLLPPGHPLDLFATATDFAGHAERVRLHSPPWVAEREHRVAIGFHAITPQDGGAAVAPLPELVFAARATASFPGAFPPLKPGEIDRLMAERGEGWPGRAAFLARLLPAQAAAGTLEDVALIDGSVLVNAPFAEAISVLQARPATREIDRRLVYIDPTQQGPVADRPTGAPGFFGVILRSLSVIPREQPIRDNLEALERQSRTRTRLHAITEGLREEVERSVERLFGPDQLDHAPGAAQLEEWRAMAQRAAARQAGYAYQAYAHLKREAVLDALAALVEQATPHLAPGEARAHLARWVARQVPLLPGEEAVLSPESAAFFRAHDLALRIRRLRHVARSLDDMPGDDPARNAARDNARDTVWQALSLYFAREDVLPPAVFGPVAARVEQEPASVLATIAAARDLAAADAQTGQLLAAAMATMPAPLRRRMLLAYLGFAFYDVATLPLLRSDGLTEMDPVKVDRISPQDARLGGPLKGQEFHNFGAFFSRAYREHDYLLGRLHGAERLLDLVASASPQPIEAETLRRLRQRIRHAVLDEEAGRLAADPALIVTLRAQVARDGPV